MKKIYRSRAPLRLGLAGGGTDVSPFCDIYGGIVLNSTIDLYSHATLKIRNDEKIIFNSIDKNCVLSFKSVSNVDINESLPIHSGVFKKILKKFKINKNFGFELITFSDAPPGSGLGSSSALVVSIIKVFDEFFKINLGNYQLAELAYEIERIDLSLKGGKQDQYAASFGGFNFINFNKNGNVNVESLKVKKWIINELESSTVLFFSGQSRDSSSIISHQIKSLDNGDKNIISAKKELKKQAVLMKKAILKGNIKEYSRILAMAWEEKKKLSPLISNSQIDEIYNYAIKYGASSGKISGAGGGGFFIFHVRPENKFELQTMLQKLPGKLINFHFESNGVESWSIL